jgi:hypothetical protein
MAVGKKFNPQKGNDLHGSATSDLVRQSVPAQVDRFTLADVAALLPTASPQLVKKALAEMKKSSKV